MRKTFPLRGLRGPAKDTDFWKWAEKQDLRDVSPLKYLKAKGFVADTHRIAEDAYSNLCYLSNMYHEVTPLLPGVWALEDLLYTTLEAVQSFYVRGAPEGLKGHTFQVTYKLQETLAEAGWVYEVRPGSTFFEISDGYLFAKYQTILGSRRIAKLKGM